MTPKRPPAHDTFSLFDNEERVLLGAETMLHQLEQFSGGVKELAAAYRKSYAEHRRLLRISDRLQLDLHKANQSLAAQAAELKRLNAALEEEVALRQQLAEELRLIATIDGLTGFYTRRHILELAAIEEKRQRHLDEPVSLALLDLDHFKQINDNYGHAAGDEVLRCFAANCRKVCRETDLIGRFGGEEFLILFPQTELDIAQSVVENLRHYIAEHPVTFDGQVIAVSASIGVTALQSSDPSLEHALSRADRALYCAKHQGRNRIEIFT